MAATSDATALLALKPDCVVHTAMADNRLTEALDDLERFLRAGINVVSSGPVFLQYPYGVVPAEMIDPIVDAAAEARRVSCGSTASTPASPTTGCRWC